MTSERYEDTVGTTARRWPASYSTCIGIECPSCKAKPGAVCTQRADYHLELIEKGAPHIVRQALGEGWAHRVSKAN